MDNQNKKNFKVAIVGAGVNGLYLAWNLAKMGHEVTVFEKNKTIGNKICSGLFSERILDFIPESKSLIQNEINSVLIHFPKKTLKIIFSKRFLVIDHSQLDKLLADLAHNQGVKILLDQKVSQIPAGYDRIIGCDGSDSFVRKHLNLPQPELRVGIQGFIAKDARQNFVEAWPCENGFLWALPRGNKAEFGIISNTKSAYRVFTNFLKNNKIELVGIKAKLIPQGLPKLKNKIMTLCGDAAGLTKPWSGGGVIWGLIAASMLLDTFPNFGKYHSKLKRFFKRRIWISRKLTKIVYFLGFRLPFLLPKTAHIESDFLF